MVDATPSQKSSGEVTLKKMRVRFDRNFVARVPEKFIKLSRELRLRRRVADRHDQQEKIAPLVNAIYVLLDQ